MTTFNRKDLLAVFKSVSSACYEFDYSYAPSAINLQFFNDKLTIAATDGHRLAYQVIIGSDSDMTTQEITIHKRYCDSLIDFLKTSKEENIGISIDDTDFFSKKIILSIGKEYVQIEAISRPFIKYQELIPLSFNHEATIKRSLLVNALKAVKGIDKRKATVKLRSSDNVLSVDLVNSDGQFIERVATLGYTGSMVPDINLNFYYLSEILSKGQTKEVTIHQNSKLEPIIIESGYHCLLMPILIRAEKERLGDKKQQDQKITTKTQEVKKTKIKKVKDTTPKMRELKAIALSVLSKDDVRNFGDLRKKATWQAAIASLQPIPQESDRALVAA